MEGGKLKIVQMREQWEASLVTPTATNGKKLIRKR